MAASNIFSQFCDCHTFYYCGLTEVTNNNDTGVFAGFILEYHGFLFILLMNVTPVSHLGTTKESGDADTGDRADGAHEYI